MFTLPFIVLSKNSTEESDGVLPKIEENLYQNRLVNCI